MLLRLFWNPRERRLPAFWRIFLTLAAFTGALAAGEPLSHSIENELLHATLEPVFALVFVLLLLAIVCRFLDRRPLADLGLRFGGHGLRDALAGLALGAVAMGLLFLALLILGRIQITALWSNGFEAPFLLALLCQAILWTALAVYEEAFFRGYLMENIAEGFRGWLGPRRAAWVAWVVSSVLFGLLHALNPGATWLAMVNLMLVGFLFGLPYLFTRSLAAPIALHFSWNFFQGNVFGFHVSGRSWGTSILRSEGPAEDPWLGGTFGVEASPLLPAVLAVALVLAMLWLRRRGAVTIPEQLAAPPDRALNDGSAAGEMKAENGEQDSGQEGLR